MQRLQAASRLSEIFESKLGCAQSLKRAFSRPTLDPIRQRSCSWEDLRCWRTLSYHLFFGLAANRPKDTDSWWSRKDRKGIPASPGERPIVTPTWLRNFFCVAATPWIFRTCPGDATYSYHENGERSANKLPEKSHFFPDPLSNCQARVRSSSIQCLLKDGTWRPWNGVLGIFQNLEWYELGIPSLLTASHISY